MLKTIKHYVGPNSIGFMLEQERKHWLLKTHKQKYLSDPNTGDTYIGRVDNLGSDIVIESRKSDEVFNQLSYIKYDEKFSHIFQTEQSGLTYNSSMNGLVFARVISTNYPKSANVNRHYRIHFRNAETVFIPFGGSNASDDVYAYKWIKTSTPPVIKLMNDSGVYIEEVSLTFATVDKYDLLNTKPSDWDTNYFDYYIKTATGYQPIPDTYANPPEFKPNSYYAKTETTPTNCVYYYPLDEALRPFNITPMTMTEWYTEGIINDDQIGLPAFWFTCDETNVGPNITINNPNGNTTMDLWCIGNEGNASKYRSHVYIGIDGHHDATPHRTPTDETYVHVTPLRGVFNGNDSDFNVPINPLHIKMDDLDLDMTYNGTNTKFYMTNIDAWEYLSSREYRIKVSAFDGNCYAYNRNPLMPLINIHFDESISFGNKTSDYGYAGIRGGSGNIVSDLYPKYPYDLNKFDGLPDHMQNPNPEDPQQHMAVYAVHNTPGSTTSDPMSRQTAAILLDPGRTQHPENELPYDFTLPEIDPNSEWYGQRNMDYPSPYENDVLFIEILNGGYGLITPGDTYTGQGGYTYDYNYTLYDENKQRIMCITAPARSEYRYIWDPDTQSFEKHEILYYGGNYDNNGGMQHFGYLSEFAWENPKNTKTDGTGFEYKDVAFVTSDSEEGAQEYTHDDIGLRFRIYRNLDSSEANYTRGRVYILSNDPISYENNITSQHPKPARTAARICDIPTSVAQLSGTKNVSPTYVVDQDYVRTEASYSEADRNRLYNVNSSRWVRPCHLGTNGLPIEHDNDFVFNSESQLNSIDLINHNDFRYLENLVPMVDPSNVSISEIVNTGEGYAVNDFGYIYIGGFGFEYHVTEVDRSGRVKTAYLASPELDNHRFINLSNFNMLEEGVLPYTDVYGTSPRTGGGTGLQVRLMIADYASIQTYKGELYEDLFALIRESDGLWLYKYDIDRTDAHTPKTGEWVKDVHIAQFEMNDPNVKFPSTADAFMASILPRSKKEYCCLYENHMGLQALDVISTASFVQIVSGTNCTPIVNPVGNNVNGFDLCKWYCDGLTKYTVNEMSIDGVLDAVSKKRTIRSDCYIAWKPVDPTDPSNMDVTVGMIYRSFNNTRSDDNVTTLPANRLQYQNYVNSNANTTVVWDVDNIGPMVWVFNPKYRQHETYRYDHERNQLVIERETMDWSKVEIHTSNVTVEESFVDNNGKLKYNIITNNPFHFHANEHIDPNVLYDQPEFFTVATIGSSIEVMSINPTGGWELVMPRVHGFAFERESGGLTQSYTPTEMNIIHDTNVGYETRVYDANTKQDVSMSTVIFEDSANGVSIRVFNSVTGQWEYV